MWDLIVLVPDYCLSFSFLFIIYLTGETGNGSATFLTAHAVYIVFFTDVVLRQDVHGH